MPLCRDFAEDLLSLPRNTPLVHLRLLATSDLHATLLPYDYYSDRPVPGVGLVGIGGLLEEARSVTPNCLLFDNGDTLQGAPLGDVAALDQRDDGQAHPMIAAMNALGYDAATLGNHDFDFGIAFLDRALADADFPIVLANAVRTETGIPYRSNDVILTRRVQDLDGQWHNLRIGVTGTAPPQVSRWNRIVLNGALVFTDALEATRRSATALKARGADVVVALAHSGLGDAETATNHDVLGPENTARAIADLPDVDVVVAGHTHEVFPEDCDCNVKPPQSPIVQPGALGSHLGCIDIALRRDRTGSEGAAPWRVERGHVRAIAMREAGRIATAGIRKALRARPLLRHQLRDQHRATRAFTDRELGSTEIPLNTYFSTVASCAATQLIADAQRAAALALVDGDDSLRNLPLLSAAAPMRHGGFDGQSNYTDIPVGPLRLRHVSDLYSYANHLAVLCLTGTEVAAWLERSASIYQQIDPEEASLQTITNTTFAGYNFDRMDGLLYDIDLSQPARTNADGNVGNPGHSRVSNLRFAEDGRPLEPDDVVLVATNTYRAAGGGNFDMFTPAKTVRTGNVPVRDHIAEHIRISNSPVRVQPRPTFRLTGFGKAQPMLQTGEGALNHRDIYEPLGLAPYGGSEDGFQRFTLAT